MSWADENVAPFGCGKRTMSVANAMAGIDGEARWRGGVTAALFVLVIGLFLVSLGIGAGRLSPWAVADALFGGGTDVAQVIVREIRLPRAILGVAIGAMLGLSGAALQGLLRNPLAAPSLFGGRCLVVVRGAQDAGKDLSAEVVRLAAAPAPVTSASRTTAKPSSPRSNVAGAIRWQYADPTHRSVSTVILTGPPLNSFTGGT